MLAAGETSPSSSTQMIHSLFFFPGRNTFIICPSKQRNRKYPSAWKWRCHLPSGSCFSLAGGGKHYVIRTFRTASNFRTVSDPLLKKNGPYFPHLVLVSSGANSAPLCKTPCLNEIGYGNVKRCRPVVSADVVELTVGRIPRRNKHAATST